MLTLKSELDKAKKSGIGVGHFNVADLVLLKSIWRAGRELNQPIIIGASEGERDFIDTFGLAGYIKGLREAYNFPIFLNADHTSSEDKIKEAVEADFDAILVDYSKLPIAENIKKTKAAVEYIKSKKPNILVEGEIGYIGSGSSVKSQIPKDAAVTLDKLPKAQEVAAYVKATGVDLIAPAVGNLHGILKNAPMPELQFKLIREINSLVEAPMVLHGGSGLKSPDFQSAIKAGVAVIHISTELRLAWRKGIERSIKLASPDEISPYKVLPPAVEEVYEVVKEKIKTFAFL